MASRSQKIIIPVEIQTQLKNIGGSFENLNQQLKNLSGGNSKEIALFTKQFNQFQTTFMKLQNFKLNTNNVEQYKGEVQKLTNQYQSLAQTLEVVNQYLNQAAKTKFDTASARVEKIDAQMQQRIQQLQSIAGDQLAGKNPLEYGVTSKSLGLTGEQATQYDKIRKSLLALAREGSSAKLELDKLQKELQEGSKDSIVFANGIQTAGKAVDTADSSMDSLNQTMRELKTKEISENIKSLAARFTGFYAIMRAGHSVIQKSIQTYKDLDASYTSIAAVAGRTREQMWALNSTFNEMAQRLGTTTEQIAEASKLYFQQGRSQSEVLELVEQTTILATTAEIDFTEATNYMTAAVNGFNIEAENSVEITDVWSNLAANAAVSVNELAVATSKVASLASSVGMSMETTSAFLSKMINLKQAA